MVKSKYFFCKAKQKLYVAACGLIIQFSAVAQNAKYFIQFTDKNNSPYTTNRPSDFLSQRSIDRRQRQQISVTTRDLPVNPAYVQAVRQTGAKVWYTSRWMNGALVEANLATMTLVRQLPFVKAASTEEKISEAASPGSSNTGTQQLAHVTQGSDITESPAYGNSYTQINMLGVAEMHAQGYTGKGMHIAVLDGGFRNTNQLPFFKHLFTEQRILGTYDFVDQEEAVYEDESHGMQVLSTIGALQSGDLVGTAYEASFWLLRTEDSSGEYRIEEVTWLIGAEFADSVGVDILHSSLGYNTFDNPAMDYRPEDMDGKTAFVTQAAEQAAATGMLVVVSAGNEGSNAWKKLTAPGDANSVLTVGAVDQRQFKAPFSSFGPSADGRVKPDVAAMGQGTVVGRADGTVGTTSGTSFSAPLVTGLAAGIWQAFPQLTNVEVISYLQRSASQASKPDSLLGYGVPNFTKAYKLIQRDKGANQPIGYLSPNPVGDSSFTLWLNEQSLSEPLTLQLFDASGKMVAKQYIPNPSVRNTIQLPALMFRRGLYLVRLSSSKQHTVLKLVKW